MGKKLFAVLMMAALLCMLAACGDSATQMNRASSIPAEETAQPPVDYSVFCGHYADNETVEGPCYMVSIMSADNAAKTIDIEISYVGYYSSPVYTTELMRVFVAENHTAAFEWEDSWTNRGTGTLVLNPGDPSQVEVMMTVLEEAEVNRATLSTHGEYKTLSRLPD